MRFLKTWRLQDEVTIRLKTWSSFFQRHIYRSTLLSELLQHVRLKTWIRKMMILDCNTLKFSKFSHHTLNLAWANVIWWTQFDIYPSKRLLFTVSTFKTMTIQWYWYTLYHIEWKRCLRLQKWTVIAKMWTVQKIIVGGQWSWTILQSDSTQMWNRVPTICRTSIFATNRLWTVHFA